MATQWDLKALRARTKDAGKRTLHAGSPEFAAAGGLVVVGGVANAIRGPALVFIAYPRLTRLKPRLNMAIQMLGGGWHC